MFYKVRNTPLCRLVRCKLEPRLPMKRFYLTFLERTCMHLMFSTIQWDLGCSGVIIKRLFEKSAKCFLKVFPKVLKYFTQSGDMVNSIQKCTFGECFYECRTQKSKKNLYVTLLDTLFKEFCNLIDWEGRANQNHKKHCITFMLLWMSNSVLKSIKYIIYKLLLEILP